MSRFSLLRIPRPQTFLYLMSLRTGVDFIILTVLINKISGLYGILALLTGYELNSLQLSMYIYSLFALGLTIYLAPYVRKQSPLQCLALAWFYALDSLINAAYTATFGVAWFWVLATHPAEDVGTTPGSSMISDTAGFTSPEYNVSRVEVVAQPAAGLQGQNAAVVGVGHGTELASGLGDAIFQSGGTMSLSIIVGLWALRVYFVVIVMAYARSCLRQHIMMNAASNYNLHTGSTTDELAENPFDESKEEGKGWKGKVGRTMLRFGTEYWLGKDAEEDAEWMRNLGGRFSNRKEGSQTHAGVGERERRRRSGTGPPLPPPDLPRFEAQS